MLRILGAENWLNIVELFLRPVKDTDFLPHQPILCTRLKEFLRAGPL
jgi:hypothetical protein